MKFPFDVIDLTHPISQTSPCWDGDCGFQHQLSLDYATCTTPVKFRVQEIKMHAGMGTHIDAPAHCFSDGKTVDALNLEELIAPCVVIDISQQAHASYQCSNTDVQSFERKYGKISKGAFVIIRTGWDKLWNEPKQYRNDLQFPSLSIEAANALLDRDIVGIGIDTLSPDTENSGYPVHQAVLGAGKYLVENIAHSDKLPHVGSFTMALPILTVGGTEAPIRLIGLIANFFTFDTTVQKGLITS